MARRSIVLLIAIIIAAVGVALVFVYVNRADERASQGQTLVSVYKAKATIDAGTPLTEALGTYSVQSEVPAGEVEGYQPVQRDDLATNQGKVARSQILVGQIIRLDQFGTSSETEVNTSTEVTKGAMILQLGDPNRIASYLKPGLKVTVLRAANGDQKSRVVLRNLVVLKVGGTGSPANPPDPLVDSAGLSKQLVTVNVDEGQALELLNAKAEGELWMLAERASGQ